MSSSCFGTGNKTTDLVTNYILNSVEYQSIVFNNFGNVTLQIIDIINYDSDIGDAINLHSLEKIVTLNTTQILRAMLTR